MHTLLGYSADMAPREPVLKLSMYRTVLFSIGTIVPPDYRWRVGEGERKRKRERGRKEKEEGERLSLL